MLIYCVRHGESSYNAEGRIQGHLNVGLSDLGRRQSEAVATALARYPIEAIYSSPLARAIETAEPIARRLGLDIQIDPQLIEINAGIFQGKRRDELAELCPAEYARWRSGDVDFTIPGGESRRDLMRRGQAALKAIAQGGYQQVCVVSHGAILAAAIKTLLEIPVERHPFLLENASISRLELTGDQVRLDSLNEIGHLDEIGLAGSGDL
jgi:broad specificity phosphatase PhoE